MISEHAPAKRPYQSIASERYLDASINRETIGHIFSADYYHRASHDNGRPLFDDIFNAVSQMIWAGSAKLNGDGQRYMVEKYNNHPGLVDRSNRVTSDIRIVTHRRSLQYSQKIEL